MALFLLLSWRRLDGALRKANIDEAMIPHLSPGARAIFTNHDDTDLELVHEDLDPPILSNAFDDYHHKY